MQKTPCHTKHNPCTTHCGAGRTANPWGSSPSSIHSGTMCSSASGKQQHTEGKHRAEFAEPAASLRHPLNTACNALEGPITNVARARLEWTANTSPSSRGKCQRSLMSNAVCSYKADGEHRRNLMCTSKGRNLSSLGGSSVSHLVMSSF